MDENATQSGSVLQARGERPRRPRIQDVARMAGVSIGSVSAVLNAKDVVSEGTRHRVQAAIAKLGYRPSLYASNLARLHTRVIGVVVSDLRIPFFAEAAYALEQEAALHGYSVTLAATGFDPKHQRASVQQLLAARVAGLAVYTSERDHETSAIIAASGVPTVFLDIGEDAPNATNIHTDFRQGMRDAVDHLIELGHRDILFVRNSRSSEEEPLLSHVARYEGFSSALESAHLPSMRVKVIDIPGPAAEAGEQAVAAALGHAPFTAVLCVTDLVAIGVYRGLQSRGLKVPEDVSVVGFDNSYLCRFLSPSLTTVNISREQLGALTVRALLPREGDGRSREVELSTELILRESTAEPNPTSLSLQERTKWEPGNAGPAVAAS